MILARALSNVTVDDTLGDPTTGAQIVYSPQAAWNDGRSCSVCQAHPQDTSLINQGTWRDTSYDPTHPIDNLSASFRFNGSAVYVFCILALFPSDPYGASDMSFFIDGRNVSRFAQPAPATAMGYQYNVPVFSSGPLPPGEHTLTIQVGSPDGTFVTMLLDSIVYSSNSVRSVTAPSSLSSSALPTASLPSSPGPSMIPGPHTTQRATIIGSVIGALLGGMFLVGAGAYLWRLYSSRRSDAEAVTRAHPFTPVPPAQSQSPATAPNPLDATLASQQTRLHSSMGRKGAEAQRANPSYAGPSSSPDSPVTSVPSSSRSPPSAYISSSRPSEGGGYDPQRGEDSGPPPSYA
ncbi:hypothetical protein HGRIS_013768 [Hohenbuehelia grisea]|uniref:Uncharacterized protein n=1 Tax=Hohenbuehelia grisea TaxID=104357 RepID=A0ABR3IWK3_9AGAR